MLSRMLARLSRFYPTLLSQQVHAEQIKIDRSPMGTERIKLEFVTKEDCRACFRLWIHEFTYTPPTHAYLLPHSRLRMIVYPSWILHPVVIPFPCSIFSLVVDAGSCLLDHSTLRQSDHVGKIFNNADDSPGRGGNHQWT